MTPAWVTSLRGGATRRRRRKEEWIEKTKKVQEVSQEWEQLYKNKQLWMHKSEDLMSEEFV